jgi:hypothetical protein
MKLQALAWMLAMALSASVSFAVPSTQPSPDASLSAPSPTTAGELMLRANEDMAKNDFASALPLLEKVSQLIADQPDQLGPILEQIRVCRRQIQLNAAVVRPAIPQSVVTAVDGATRKIHPIPAVGQTLMLPIKELGNFDYDAENGGDIPDDVRHLDGCHFQTSGYMIPLDQAESISEFALVPSLFACCFGQPPQVQHTIVVHCPKGKAVGYFPDELVVEGTLHVAEQRDGGFIVSIFQIDASSVRPSDK